jgi:thiol-disulfide isomerase/thioredoxin
MDDGMTGITQPTTVPHRRASIFAIGLLALGVLGLLWAGIQEARRTQPVPTERAAAPPFHFQKFGGGQFDSEALRGRVVMLDFWATWCGPCVAEMPTLVKLAQEYESKGVVFVAANRDDERVAKVEVGLFVDRRVPALAQYVAFADDQTADGYAVSAIPTMFLIDRQGRIHGSYLGAASERTWRARLDEALRAN